MMIRNIDLTLTSLFRASVFVVTTLFASAILAANSDTKLVKPKHDEERIGGIGGTGLYKSMESPKQEIERLERPESIERPERPTLNDALDLNRPDSNTIDKSPERPETQK